MWIADGWKDYELIDCGSGEKLERWGKYILVRPDPQAIWQTPRTDPRWNKANARYARSSTGGGQWAKKELPARWTARYKELTFNIKPMNFKHTGLFPEQAANWDFCGNLIRKAGRPISVLNLFAYTGGATVACAAAGASVCHVDAARGMVSWARENAQSSGLSDAPIRYIVDDCGKFAQREIRRGHTYDGIIMDPPSYGRGPSGEIWKLEENLWPFVELVAQLLSDNPLGADLYLGNPGHKKARRTYGKSGAGAACHQHRVGSSLWGYRPVVSMRPQGVGSRTRRQYGKRWFWPVWEAAPYIHTAHPHHFFKRYLLCPNQS